MDGANLPLRILFPMQARRLIGAVLVHDCARHEQLAASTGEGIDEAAVAQLVEQLDEQQRLWGDGCEVQETDMTHLNQALSCLKVVTQNEPGTPLHACATRLMCATNDGVHSIKRALRRRAKRKKHKH